VIGTLALSFERDGADVVLTLPPGVRARYSVSASPDEPGPTWAEAEGVIRVEHGPGPAYVHLVTADLPAAVVGARRLAMDGTLNFRDLGGYPGEGGRTLRWGRLFRSDHLGAVTEADLALLDAVGVKLVIDFRSDAERAEYGSLRHPGVELRREPLVEELVDQVTPLERIMRRELTSWTAEDMAAMYRSMLDRFPLRFGAVVAAAADVGNHPLVFHCTAGKDRTGLAAALILRTLGVSVADTLDDYELTHRVRTERRIAELRPRFAAAGIDLEPLMAFFAPPRAAMVAALDHLEQRHGGVNAYLTGPAEVSEAALSALREGMLTPLQKP
jgi:protein-tyrosine phosphatase